jgi:phospholipid transport system transporter-binding protein
VPSGSGRHGQAPHGRKAVAALSEVEPGRLALRGSLTLDSIPSLARQAQRLFKSLRRADSPPPSIAIDLGGIERGSSAGIALLLDWVDQADRAGLRLRFEHWPDSLRRIAQFSNVEALLGLEDGTLG